MTALPDTRKRLWSALQRGEVVRSPACSISSRFFHVTLVPLSSIPTVLRFAAVLEDKTEQERATEEMRDLITRAHCLIWYAEVEEQDHRLLWRFEFPHLEATRQWLPIRQVEGQPFDWSWAQARLPEDSARVDAIGENALRAGQSSYQHESRLRLENGELLRVVETVQIEPAGPGRWSLIGICTDATARGQAEDEVPDIMTSARCLIWHAEVEGDPAAELRWDLRLSNEAAVQRWLPIAVSSEHFFLQSWEQARLPEDQIHCDRNCAAALSAGLPRFSQTFRVRLADGQLRWLAEDVQIEPLGTARWRLVGVCTDITERQQEHRVLNDIITHVHCLVWDAVVEDSGGYRHWNLQVLNEDAAHRWLSVPMTAGRTFTDAWFDARFPEDLAACRRLSDQALLSGQPGYTQEFRVRLADGHVRWLAEDAQIESLGPNRWHVVGVCTDITERKQQHEALNDIITHARCLVWRADVSAEGDHMLWDLQVFNEEAARRWLELSVLPGQTFVDAWIEARFPDDIQRGEEIYHAALREGKTSYRQEYRSLQAGGQVRWLAEDVQIETLGPGRWQFFGVCTDITERKALEEERERILAQALDQADRDPLTGLFNHRAFHAHLAREADRALREDSVLGIAVIDLDNFKFFNDAYGHLSGDDVLRQVAAALHHACRSYDTLARYGGDEFAVLMPGAAPADVERLAARLASCLDQVRYRPPEATSDIPLSLSVGMAVFPQDASSPLAALHLADERLLRVKSGDRGNGIQAEQLRARLVDGVEGFSMLDALVVAVDNKDRYTRSHSEGVLFYCLQIAEELGLEAEAVHALQVAALLHDVGKIGIPDHILRKPGRLTESEYRAMKQHPVMGAAIVGAVPGLEGTLDAVRYHHERSDGQGYPDGLAGEQTPLSARIMAVADAYSAMTTDRPYRKGMSPDAARAVLADGVGTQWDPGCVQAFLTAQRKLSCLKANVPLFHSLADITHSL